MRKIVGSKDEGFKVIDNDSGDILFEHEHLQNCINYMETNNTTDNNLVCKICKSLKSVWSKNGKCLVCKTGTSETNE